MKIKKAVSYAGKHYPVVEANFHISIWKALPVVDRAFKKHGHEAVISAGSEKFFEIDGDPNFLHFIHSIGSFHNLTEAQAVDLSCAGIPIETILKIKNEIVAGLLQIEKFGPGYQLIFHGKYGHFHLEYDPK